MAKRVGEGVDVLVCHPSLVQTGLDLVELPTISWYETELPVLQSTPNAALLVCRGLASETGVNPCTRTALQAVRRELQHFHIRAP